MTEFRNKASRLLSYDDYLINDQTPSEWAEKNRVMTSDVSPFPGAFSYSRTPYLREIADCAAIDHPSKEIAIMKGSQLGFSTGIIENIIGWLIAENPCNILLAARDEGLVKKMMDKKIDQMIDSCDLRSLIRPNVIRARNQRTGDTSLQKEFAGGTLEAFSIQKPARMRQISMQFGFLDDFEAAPADKDAGGAEKLFKTRFAAYYSKMKIFYISTPEVKHKSNIEPLYMRGDQRKYNVPCPLCGDFITLEWKVTGSNNKRAGITFQLDDLGSVISDSVGYTCQSCGGFFNEGHKHEMNSQGFWKPTSKSINESFYSYHLSSLYAPPGMYDWEYYAGQYAEAFPKDLPPRIDDYKVFINTCLGETWEERGQRPKVNILSRNTRHYAAGVVPNELSKEEGNGQIVMVVLTCDLGGTQDDARVDYEVVAWSESLASYSVDHGSIGTFVPKKESEKSSKKNIDRVKWSYNDYDSLNVWDEILKIMKKDYPTDSDSSEFYRVNVTGIDTGKFTVEANNFIHKANYQHGFFTVGVKGAGLDKFRMFDANTKVYKKSADQESLYHIQVNQVKDELAGLIKLVWKEDEAITQPRGFLNFPAPQAEKYTMKSFFIHYESEHKIMKVKDGKEVGYMWEKRKSTSQNHFWDVRVYNMACREILADAVCKEAGVKESNWRAYCQIITG